MGNALAFVMPALREKTAAVFTERVCKRVLLIFAIGLFLNASPFVRWDADGALVLFAAAKLGACAAVACRLDRRRLYIRV